MGRYIGPSCRLCRREGMKLFLKGVKCHSEKCTLVKRAYGPGDHGKMRTKLSNYGLQLREKQKVKTLYGVLERQFRKYFAIAAKTKGVTGKILLQLLERRLDNVIIRTGFATSHAQARQAVRHGAVYVNDRRVTTPSFLVKSGNVIQLKAKEAVLNKVRESVEATKDWTRPGWLEVDSKGLSAKVIRLPEKDDIAVPVQEQMIVELYSK
ncbi:MAG: 30S ribosomal protein S4 [Candidatus Omnitrophica bacterium]|nr:30S ribosomal protein S4 [Candidatus Omnitrophota bacterium]